MSTSFNHAPFVLRISGLPELTFNNIDQVEEWHRKQAEDWQELTNSQGSRFTESWRRQFFQQIQSASSEIANYRSAVSNPDAREKTWQNISEMLQD
jgi:hypothetical protein